MMIKSEIMEEHDRIRCIDIAKGVAIICIILGHLGNSNINRVVFTFHVPIFYFITGFFINDKRSVKEFTRVKFKTLIVPYVLTCIVMIFLGTLKGWIFGDAIAELKRWSYAAFYGAGDTYTTPFYIPGIGSLWFLLATFWGSCLLRISLNFDKYVRIIFVSGLFAVGYFSRAICWFPFSIQAGACATFFMYMGHLLKELNETIDDIPQETKCFGIIFAVITWLLFIRDFQSFWLVHCDIGRGIVDIFGCMCASLIVVLISKVLDSKTNYIAKFLSYFGKYSLLVLCVHSIELNLFPWDALVEKFVQYGLPESCKLLSIIIVKIIVDLFCAYLLSKSSFVRKLFGYKN